MKEVVLIKNGEIALKGLNRRTFEDILTKSIRRAVRPAGEFSVTRAQSTMYVLPQQDNCDMDLAVRRLQHVFGIVALSRACVVEKDLEAIKQAAGEYLKPDLQDARTFKVEAKRADKKFPFISPEIAREVGGYLLEQFPHLKVDVQNPDLTVVVEVRDFGAYVHARQLPGAGGMPYGSSGRAMLLLSGGIDSPVAGYMMAKRGVELLAIHFESPPYTSVRAKQKVLDLAKILCEYCPGIPLYCVHFTDVQTAIKDNCPEEFFTVIMRRMMMRIAQALCEKTQSKALITGESLAQVASQTMDAIASTDAVCKIPVFRPVIGMDKSEIVAVSQKIGTFETSILPYDDCCTVFTPKHPKTKPRIADLQKAEEALDIDSLVAQAVEKTEKIIIKADD